MAVDLPRPPVDEDIGVNTSAERRIGDIVTARLSRRDALRGLAGTALAATTLSQTLTSSTALAAGGSTLKFTEIAHGLSADQTVAPGYTAQVLIRWGDK